MAGNQKQQGATYAGAGVDIAAGEGAKERIKQLAKATRTPGVLGGVGGFGGLFSLDLARFPDPVLVASTDGVGTKLKLAFELGLHGTVGADLVNHCVNDIAVQGAEPLFFMDYLATGKLSGEVVAEVVGGIARACRENGCALLGGETAQMPGFYGDGEYDLAGTIVGAVSRPHLLTGAGIEPGDVLLGLPSTGLHTNGYSLARKLLLDRHRIEEYVDALGGTVGEVLMRVHRSYLEPMQTLRGLAVGFAHITGGGITENLPRILPQDCGAEVELGSWPVPPIFQHIRELGGVQEAEMLRTFNMGIGLIAVVPETRAAEATALLGEPSYRIGTVVPGLPEVRYKGALA